MLIHCGITSGIVLSLVVANIATPAALLFDDRDDAVREDPERIADRPHNGL